MMTEPSATEVIVIRSLTDSDLGLFSAHRASARSKQRAININSPVARKLLNRELFEIGRAEIKCVCIFDGIVIDEPRTLVKSGKNWRLGGRKIEGEIFSRLDSKDFVLIRSVAENDGSHPVTITFICRSTDRITHAGLAAIAERHLERSMAVYPQDDAGFDALARYCPYTDDQRGSTKASHRNSRRPTIPPMPYDDRTNKPRSPKTVHDRVRTPHMLERMLKVAGDLSAPAQLRFMETVEELASELRKLLLATDGIMTLKQSHAVAWREVAGRKIGFVDGGLANLSVLGSAPIAARVGGYVVTPGDHTSNRESFTMLRYLIGELYADEDNGVYSDTFPDISALRDAARIAIEAAGAVRMAEDQPDISWIFVHGALVNPVSRYTDIMKDRKVVHSFPHFSQSALEELLPAGEPARVGRDRNFVSVYLRQLQYLRDSSAVVAGVIEREATTSSVIGAVLDNFDDLMIQDMLPDPPDEWKRWFKHSLDPSEDEDVVGQRITDSLLFRCVLEPGEALRPVDIDRNEMRRAPRDNEWREMIVRYPVPKVSYVQINEWSSPIRIEIFEENILEFEKTASLVMHCAMLLPRYAFPVGLDIVDKFARVPNWMSRPINTHTAVQAMKVALDRGDENLFDGLRRMLCGSSREFFLRPSIDR